MAEQRRPGSNSPPFESPDFETDTSRTVTPREIPVAPAGNVLSAPPRPRVPPGQGSSAPGAPARPPAQGGPERRPLGPSPFLERRAPSPPSPEARRKAWGAIQGESTPHLTGNVLLNRRDFISTPTCALVRLSATLLPRPSACRRTIFGHIGLLMFSQNHAKICISLTDLDG